MSTNVLTVNLSMTGQETLDAADLPAAAQVGDRTLRLGGLNLSATLNSTSTPTIGKSPVQINLTIGASPTTIDLTVVDIGIGRTADMTGLKLVAWMLKASSSNAAKITIGPAAVNGYELFGAADDYQLQKGETAASAITGVASGRDAVGPTDKDITVNGTQNDTLEMLLWFGT